MGNGYLRELVTHGGSTVLARVTSLIFCSHILTGGLLDTQYKLLSLLYCMSHQDSPLVPYLGPDISDQPDSSCNYFDYKRLYADKFHSYREHTVQVLVLCTVHPVGRLDTPGCLPVRKYHLGSEQDPHLDEHS